MALICHSDYLVYTGDFVVILQFMAKCVPTLSIAVNSARTPSGNQHRHLFVSYLNILFGFEIYLHSFYYSHARYKLAVPHPAPRNSISDSHQLSFSLPQTLRRILRSSLALVVSPRPLLVRRYDRSPIRHSFS